MKKRTGKPKAKPRKPPKPVVVGPLDVQQRYSLRETAAYLKTSLPTVHKLINGAMLEAFKEGSRTFVTGRSIAAKSVPPT
jgi:hypothetical protein